MASAPSPLTYHPSGGRPDNFCHKQALGRSGYPSLSVLAPPQKKSVGPPSLPHQAAISPRQDHPPSRDRNSKTSAPLRANNRLLCARKKTSAYSKTIQTNTIMRHTMAFPSVIYSKIGLVNEALADITRCARPMPPPPARSQKKARRSLRACIPLFKSLNLNVQKPRRRVWLNHLKFEFKLPTIL